MEVEHGFVMDSQPVVNVVVAVGMIQVATHAGHDSIVYSVDVFGQHSLWHGTSRVVRRMIWGQMRSLFAGHAEQPAKRQFVVTLCEGTRYGRLLGRVPSVKV